MRSPPDLFVPGLSWMDSLAAAGYDTWALDFRGFGQSSRPPAPASIEAVSKVFMAADPTSAQRTPPTIRRAMGPMVDLYSIWSNKAIYDTTNITAPVLVIAGDSDHFADPTLFCSLTNSPDRREVIIPQATHWALYETHRDVLLSQTQTFLGVPPASTPSSALAKCKK